jgi:protein ImuA
VQRPDLAVFKARFALTEGNTAGVLSLGALPALPRAGLHEIGGDAAAGGFCTTLAGLLAGRRSFALWCVPQHACHEAGALYGPGLVAYGLDSARLVIANPRHLRDALWTLEEALRSGIFSAVIGEAETLPPIAARRLQLAAEAHGAAALLLLPHACSPAVGVSRWRVTSAPSGAWHVELTRCRSGASGTWLVEWNNATHRFDLAALSGKRPDTPASSGLVRQAAGAGH